MARPDDPVLDLSTLVERPTIRIDGETYEILSPDELSILDLQRLSSDGRRIYALAAEDAPLTAEAEGQFFALIRKTSARIMVGVPEELRERLSDRHMLMVIEGFMRLLLAGSAAATTPRRSTGAMPSPVSNGSSAETRSDGLPASPSPSSAPI